MPPASRHAKSKAPAIRRGAPVVAAATLAGVAAAFVSLQGGSAAAPMPARYVIPVASAGSSVAHDRVTAAVRHDVAVLEVQVVQRTRTAARHRYLAAVAAARLAPQHGAPATSAAGAGAAEPEPQPEPEHGTSAIQRRRGRCPLGARDLHPQR